MSEFNCVKCGGSFDPSHRWCPICDTVTVEHTEQLRIFNQHNDVAVQLAHHADRADNLNACLRDLVAEVGLLESYTLSRDLPPHEAENNFYDALHRAKKMLAQQMPLTKGDGVTEAQDHVSAVDEENHNLKLRIQSLEKINRFQDAALEVWRQGKDTKPS